jgi:hypothetical protein
MNMTKRNQLLSLATLTALTFLSTAPRANDVADNSTYRTAPQSCAEATKSAWFYRQLELTDGDTSPEVALPAECLRQVQASNDDAK